ncbi:hypothetical protein IMZ48_06980 [Candidatus Bathyarchaeota archaeon]|nr:hypothetical protein [Candidatus Bathyarchaeota archaeon]
MQELGTLAATKNKVFALNLAAPFIPEFFKDVLDAAVPYTDLIIGNETEAASYAKSHALASDAPRDVALALANLPKENAQRKRTVVITQGTEPTLVAIQGETEVKEFPVHAIDPSKINDTNGAGDAFAGGFLAGLVAGKPLETSVDMGQWLARLSIQELGPS